MSAETVTIVLSILGAIGAWTVTVALLVLWLSNRFRSLERAIFVEASKTRKEIARDIEVIWKRVRLMERQLLRLQLKVFGTAPMDFDEILNRLQEPQDGPLEDPPAEQ